MRLGKLAVPIVTGMLLQNFMGLADLAMLSRLGAPALAAVSPVTNLLLVLSSLIFGIGTAVQIAVARSAGAEELGEVSAILNRGLRAGVFLGLLLLIISYLFLPSAFQLVADNESLVVYGHDYLYTLIPGSMLMGLTMIYVGFWLGLGKPSKALLVLALQLALNVLLNYALIYGNWGLPKMGISGAGLGTSIAALIGLMVNKFIAFTYIRDKGWQVDGTGKVSTGAMLRIATPISLQQSLFAVGVVVFIGIVAQLGTESLAAFNVVLGISLIFFLCANGFGVATTTLVAGALGASRPQEAERWGWTAGALGTGLLAVLGAILFVSPDVILSMLISEPAVREIAVLPLQLMVVGFTIEAYGKILSFGLIGAGAAGTVFRLNSLHQWLLRLPLCWYFGIHLGYGLVGIFWVTLLSYILLTALFVHLWRGQHWRRLSH